MTLNQLYAATPGTSVAADTSAESGALRKTFSFYKKFKKGIPILYSANSTPDPLVSDISSNNIILFIAKEYKASQNSPPTSYSYSCRVRYSDQ